MEHTNKKNLTHVFKDVKVLYVEDDLFSREKLVRILQRRFSHVYTATDGEEGFELFLKHKPELIIADIKMNQMSGLDMIEKIRGINDQVQVIVTTAHDDSEFFIRSIEYNVNHFILKPIELDRFLIALQKSAQQIQLELELNKQKKFTRAILDFQDHLIFVVENDEIVEFNSAFSKFTGMKKDVHLHKGNELSQLIVDDINYFTPKDRTKWIVEFLERPEKHMKIRLRRIDGKTCIFHMKATNINQCENQFLFVCTDISELEEESKRNKHLAMMDPLTNSFNRLKFDEILTSEIRRSERYHHPFSLIMMDIDHFKKVNDCFGHQIGDEVLCTISTIVQQRIRESDIFARWGGEEFIILAPETTIKGAVELAESIRSLINNFSFQKINHITCSFGVAEFNAGKSKRELFSEVDQALYQAKNKGKNCVSVYKEEIISR
jgi:two-component system, cell cycle response regulator